jgi:hypothetical protein
MLKLLHVLFSLASLVLVDTVFNWFQGKISVVDIVGLSKSDIVTSKGEGNVVPSLVL